MNSLIDCACCGLPFDCANGRINRAIKLGHPLYCGKVCAGKKRRVDISDAEKKEAKRLYDVEYRRKNAELLKQKKAEYFKATYDPQKAAIHRKQHMQRHVEYCRKPEYKEYKRRYDAEHRAKKEYGEFWQCFLIVASIDKEVSERASPLEINSQNGTLNKRQTRKREYERLNRN